MTMTSRHLLAIQKIFELKILESISMAFSSTAILDGGGPDSHRECTSEIARLKSSKITGLGEKYH
jgi:hypothetical protein